VLADLPAQETVLLCSFSGKERVFTVFVREKDDDIVGCIGVLRGAPPPTLKEQLG